MPAHVRTRALTRRGALRVPEITVLFWVVKAISTALGESTSDFLVHEMSPYLAVALGFVGFVVALALQLSRKRYVAWAYWLAVAAVGVFGTMAADAMHIGAGVPYPVSTAFYAVVLAAVFVAWQRTEHTLSIHAIDTARREIFYWLAVCATFAMGTALGDLTASTFRLGYLASGILFALLIAVPAAGYRFFGWNPVASFWVAYVMTRPLGASFADYMGKPTSASGLGWGDGPVAAVLALVMVVLVAFLAVTRADVQRVTDRSDQPARSDWVHAGRGAAPVSTRPWAAAGGVPRPVGVETVGERRLVSGRPHVQPVRRVDPTPERRPRRRPL